MIDTSILFVLFVLHTTVSFLAGYYLFSQFIMDKEQARVWKWLGIVFSFFLPVFGLIGIFTIYFSLRWKNRTRVKTKPLVAYDDHLRKDRISAKAQYNTIMQIDWQEEKEIQPLVDALKGEDLDLRKGAVDALAEKGDREAIKMLADSLENTMLEVRYFAVEALAKIGKDFGDKIIKAQEELATNPDSHQALIELADCYYEYAVSAVEDKTLSNYYLLQAFNEYTKAVAMNDARPELLVRYGEILTKLNKYPEALETFNKALKESQKSDNTEALIGLADVYFRMGEIKKVKHLAEQLKSSTGDLPDDLMQAISIWV